MTSALRARLLAACAAALLVLLVPGSATAATDAPADPGSIGIRLLDAPVDAKDDPRARVYIVDHLPPGTTIERRIEVSNTTAETAKVSLYPGPATIADGSFVGGSAGEVNDLTTWTTVTPDAPEVSAGGTAEATVTIAVPADAPPGEQYGVVWAEVRSAEAEGGVTQVSRVGIRLYVSVGPGGAPPTDFTIEALTAERTADGLPTVLATVRNTGGRALDMNGTLQLLGGPGGLSAGPFPASLGSTLAIGATEPVRIELDKALPDGPWDAEITLKSGIVERTAEATITFPEAGAAAAPVAVSTRPAWLYPVIAAVVLVLLVGLFAALARRRRRPRDEEPSGTAALQQSLSAG